MVCFILVMRNGLCDQLGKTHKSILVRETFFAIFLWGGGGGGGRGEFDTSREITGKILRGKKNIIGNIISSQTSRLTEATILPIAGRHHSQKL